MRVARRIARRMTNVPITYSPRHLLRHSPHHSWRSLSKRFFKHESKGTKGDSGNSSFEQKQRHMNVRASSKARHKHECVSMVSENSRECWTKKGEQVICRSMYSYIFGIRHYEPNTFSALPNLRNKRILANTLCESQFS